MICTANPKYLHHLIKTVCKPAKWNQFYKRGVRVRWGQRKHDSEGVPHTCLPQATGVYSIPV